MGVFSDFRITNREAWRFTYTGAELLPHARKKYAEYNAAEGAARRKMAALMLDRSVDVSDQKMGDLRREIERVGTEKEKCMVWVHEFSRKPDQTFSLVLGDVTYFDVVTADTLPPAPVDDAVDLGRP